MRMVAPCTAIYVIIRILVEKSNVRCATPTFTERWSTSYLSVCVIMYRKRDIFNTNENKTKRKTHKCTLYIVLTLSNLIFVFVHWNICSMNRCGCFQLITFSVFLLLWVFVLLFITIALAARAVRFWRSVRRSFEQNLLEILHRVLNRLAFWRFWRGRIGLFSQFFFEWFEQV